MSERALRCEACTVIGDDLRSGRVAMADTVETLCNRAEWVDLYFRHFGAPAERPHLLCVFDGEDLVGGLALSQSMDRKSGLARWLAPRLISTAGRRVGSEFCDMLALPGREQSVAVALSQHLVGLRSWDRLRFRNTLGGSNVCRHLMPALQRLGLTCALEPAGTRYLIPRQPDGHDYISRLGPRRRKNPGNSKRHFERNGFHYQVVEPVETAFADLVRLHNLRFGAAGAFCKPEFRAFHQDLLSLWAAAGHVCIGLLRSKDQVIAAEHSFRFNGTEFCYQGGFDPAYGNHSPGRVAAAECIETAFKEGAEAVDLMTSPEPGYKADMGGEGCPVQCVQVLSTSIGSRCYAIARRVADFFRGEKTQWVARP